MNPDLIEDFIQLIARRTGIQIRDKDHIELVKKIGARKTALKLATPEAYYQLLDAPQASNNKDKITQANSSAQEWEALTLLLTTGETYFFRDRGQLNLVQETVLPEIIARKQQARVISQTKPSLRIWSAGCSSGEEAYSLATIVQELVPNYSNWNLLILGTDINTESIAKAKAGSYSEWSFRMVNPSIKQRYFKLQDRNWQLDDRIRQMVTFRSGNLLTDDYPSVNSNIYNMDIIICRNVFIYFDAENIETILGKFYQALSPGGYLISGHAELHDLNLRGFMPKAYEESVVYQRAEDIREKPVSSISIDRPATSRTSSHQTHAYEPIAFKPAPQNPKTSQLHHTTKPQSPSLDRSLPQGNKSPAANSSSDKLALHNAQAIFDRGNYPLAIEQAEQILKQHPHDLEAISLIAHAFSNLVQYEKAISFCEQAIAIDPLSTKIYCLLAHIAKEQSNFKRAKDYLKRIIYIDKSAIAAYLDLGYIYRTEANSRRAKQMFDTAIELLNKLSPNTIIQYQGKVKVSELLDRIGANL
jgi:chemotaxis protein methyltransferase CheR